MVLSRLTLGLAVVSPGQAANGLTSEGGSERSSQHWQTVSTRNVTRLSRVLILSLTLESRKKLRLGIALKSRANIPYVSKADSPKSSQMEA